MSNPILKVEVPDRGYWKRQINCQSACPVNTDARGYVRAIAEGNDELAYLIARGPNPLASICGWVCGAPCEKACRRGAIDEPIAIRSLKRYVCEQFGPGARPDGGKTLIEFLKEAAKRHAPRQCQGKEEILPLLQALMKAKLKKVEDKSVAIIGAGPAGLAAAHDLALLGFSVTIYEMEPVLGGMLAVGIPQYRLPRQIIQAEVEVILSLGVRAITSCCVGRDISFPEIRAQHDAVIIAVGAKRSRESSLPGSDAAGVIGGVEFLRDIALGNTPRLGQRVVVVGGGDAAMDAARTALRVGSEDDDEDHYLALDAARSASHLGSRDVQIVYRRSRAEMPAVRTEIDEAEQEGIDLHLLTSPVRIEKDEQGKLGGIWCQKMELGEPDSSGRRKPVPVEGSDYFVECDSVLLAIGQTFDLSFLDLERDNLKTTEWGTVQCDPETGSTSVPDIFVAGDLAYGTKLLIHAVASGKAVARSVYQKLTGNQITMEDVELHFPIGLYGREFGYEKQPRQAPRMVSLAKRFTEQASPVELGFETAKARREASRCLDCGVNTIFDGNRCVSCGGCVDVCPTACLKLIRVSKLEGVQAFFEEGMNQLRKQKGTSELAALIKDEERCIRCGLCALRCPADAITMERFSFQECCQ